MVKIRTSIRHRFRFAPVLLGAMLLLAACGNGDDETVDDPATDEVEEEAEEDQEEQDEAGEEIEDPAEPAEDEDLPVVSLLAFNTGLGQMFLSAIETEGFDVANGFEGDFIYVEPAAATETFLQQEADVSIQMDLLVAGIARNAGHEVSVVAPSLTNNVSIIAGPDSGIESPADLVGRRVGHYGIDSGGTSIMRFLLERDWGIDLVEETEFIQAGPPALVELLIDGEVDAILDFTPHSERAIINGGQVILRADDPSHGFISGLAAVALHEDWAAENPDLVRAVSDAINDAFLFFTESDYEVFRDEPYRELLATRSDEELDEVIRRAQEEPLMTGDWDESVVEDSRAFLQEVADQGILFDDYPGDATAVTLD